MQWKNSDTHYGFVSKFLHWALAICVLLMLALGLELSNLNQAWKTPALEIHKSLGIIVLKLAILAIFWRFYTKPPHLPASTKSFLKIVAYTNHALLYALMICMPLSGWAMSSAFGKPVVFLEIIPLPDLIAKNLHTALLLKATHSFIAFTIIGLVTLHVAATLYHHLILKNKIVKRIL